MIYPHYARECFSPGQVATTAASVLFVVAVVLKLGVVRTGMVGRYKGREGGGWWELVFGVFLAFIGRQSKDSVAMER